LQIANKKNGAKPVPVDTRTRPWPTLSTILDFKTLGSYKEPSGNADAYAAVFGYRQKR
jgi:hypothetical protein